MAPKSRVSFLTGLVFIHFATVTAFHTWYKSLSPLRDNKCPGSSEENECYELVKSSSNCSYICANAQQNFLYADWYHLCVRPGSSNANDVECDYYECRRKCCIGWGMDEFGKCSIERSGIDCLHGGTPVDDACICTKYFTGKNCETAICDDVCLNGGGCRQVDQNMPPKCICTANFTGNYCEQPVCGEGCMNSGVCQAAYFRIACVCRDGFIGDHCEIAETTKRPACRILQSSYDTSCAQSCKSDWDCPQEETCCEHQGTNICIVKEEKAQQTCNYDGPIPNNTLRAGEVVTDVSGKTCRCMPGYVTGVLQCGVEICGKYDLDENTCAHHGDGVMNNDDLIDEYDLEGDKEYFPPRIINCPDSRVLVEIWWRSNVGFLYHQFRALDYLGEELPVHVSQQQFFACNCSLGSRVRVNATTVDRHGGKTTCCFTVELVDPQPPRFTYCPIDIYAVEGEIIFWQIPKATDNVGIRNLWLEPRVHNGSKIAVGDYMFRYIAEDWQGNKAECRFFVSVKGLDSSEDGWSSDLKSRIRTNTSVVIGASITGILAIALLVLIVVVFHVCRRAKVFERRTLRCLRSANRSNATSSPTCAQMYGPPTYEVASKDKLPDYKPRDDPPVYDDICKDDGIGGGSNPIYTVSGSVKYVRGIAVNPNSVVTDV